MHNHAISTRQTDEEEKRLSKQARAICLAFKTFYDGTFELNDEQMLFILHTAHRVDMESRRLSAASFTIKRELFANIIACDTYDMMPQPVTPPSQEEQETVLRRFHANIPFLVKAKCIKDPNTPLSKEPVFAHLDAETKSEIVSFAVTAYTYAYENNGIPRIPPSPFNG